MTDTSDIVIEIFDKNGIMVERSITTQVELQLAHDERRCSAFCSICYYEATKYLQNKETT